MAKEASKKAATTPKTKAPKGERKHSQLVYTFNAEKARALRDGDYKDKKSLIAVVLRVLCAARKEGYTYEAMSELVKADTGSLPTRSQFPFNRLREEGILKASKERVAVNGSASTASAPAKAAKAAKAAPKARKAKAAKAEAPASEAQAQEEAVN